MQEKWKKYESGGDRTLVNIAVDPIFSFVINHLLNSTSEKTKKVLDIGCGEGTFYWKSLFRRREVQYTGIDILPISIRNRILSLLLSNYKILRGNAEKELEFDDDSFDLLFSKLVLHNFSDMDSHFREVFRVLRRGGYYLIVVLNGDYIVDKLGRRFEDGERLEYPLGKAGISFTYYFRTREDIVRYATKQGFEETNYFSTFLHDNFIIDSLKDRFPEIMENYERAMRIKPFDFVLLHKKT
ncbi:MAG: class I SAM-dependent methyltransferase [Candidatus Gracilibacteria bacterium]|nr:class I SAM-dependent methyltransferase [Candidatus Gracilibacteria bacterium]